METGGRSLLPGPSLRQSQWGTPHSIVAGLASIAGYAVLIVTATIASVFGPERLAPGAPKWLFPIVNGALITGSVKLIAWLVRVGLKQIAWAGMALPATRGVRFGVGFVSGAILLLLVFVVQHALGWLQVAGVDTLSAAVPRMAVGLPPALAVGLSEELTFRGYVFETLRKPMPVWAAAGLSAALFAMFQLTIGGFGLAFVVTICLALTFTILRVTTGSLWFAIGFHRAWDWTQDYLVGVANVGRAGPDTALVRVTQGGPIFRVGRAPAIEGGMIYGVALLGTLAAASVYAASRRATSRWSRRLAVDGSAA